MARTFGARNVPKVSTDKADYTPGSTALLTAEGFARGATVEFSVQHVFTPGLDLVWGTLDDQLGNNSGLGHAPWSVTDGGAGDLDGRANGQVQTTWYVDPDDSLGATFLLTATGSAPQTGRGKADAPAETKGGTETGGMNFPAVNSAAVAVATTSFTDSNPLPVQFFYVPKTEADLFLALQTIEGSDAQEGYGVDPVNPMYTYVSIAAVANGTVIYYDHWEDGYETNISNPTQSSTQIWGDGNLTNGIAPGTTNDLINAGTVLVLQNAIDTSAPQVMDDYDGGDKVAATKTVAMTRVGWASGSDTLLTSGLEVFDTSNYGTDYKIPVGVNIPDETDFQMFEYTGIFIQAGQLGAEVKIDADANGSIETTVTLTEGQSYLVNGNVNVGARVLSDNPIQVGLMTGDIGSNYESRDAALLPVNLWSSSYYTPVSTPHSVVGVGGSTTYVGTDTTVWLYNPGASAIDVTFEYRDSGALVSSTLSVPGGAAGGYLKQIIPEGSGAHFSTASGEKFYAISTTDSANDSVSTTGYGYYLNQNFDWGFDLVPESSLTSQVLVGLGLGRDPNSNAQPGQNGSPVWITPAGNGDTPVTIYVDYNGDNQGAYTDPNGFHYDTTLSLKELERARVFDPDGNQTGMLLYTLTPGVKLAAAWGEDPLSASIARPGIDTGTGVTPLPTFDAGKSSSLLVDADHDGFTSPGDTLLYTISIGNAGRAPVLELLLQDTLSTDVSYVAGSTLINRNDGNGFVSLSDAGSTAYPLDEGGAILGDLAVSKNFIVTFQAKIDAFVDLTPGVKTIINTGTVTSDGFKVPFVTVDPLYGSIGDFVWLDLNSDGVQDGGSEIGIANVALNLYLDANSNSIIDAGDSIITTQTTDANGNYLFTGLLAGSYIVDVVNSTVPANYQLTTNNDPKPVALAGGQDYLQADFGYAPVSSISGHVYKDAGNDGLWDGTSAGIAGVSLTLSGYDALGNYIVLNATTDDDGYYGFTGLNASDPNLGYTVTEAQPPLYFDGKETAGSSGGNTTVNDVISAIILPAGVASVNNNFGELPPALISGYVYQDAGNDGVWDGESAGITGVKLSLTGVNDLGNAVQKNIFSGIGGRYDFVDLRPGTYTLTETQPTGYLDGTDTAGTATPGSTPGSAGNVGTDIISGITLVAGGVSSDNNFGEIRPGGLSGFVYVDADDSGTRQVSEAKISGVTLTLSGSNDLGTITPLSTTSNISGFYSFGNLRPGTYTVTESQPAAYVDGQDTQGNLTPIPGSRSTDYISGISVVAGSVTPNNNFGEVLPATVSGFVYLDTNDNGNRAGPPSEPGISDVSVTLTGKDDLGNSISLSATTAANGAYSFSGLRPSSVAGYTVSESQPANYVDGKDSAGSSGGSVAVNDVISGIVVGAGGSSANNNFGELLPVSVSGHVYVDAGNDGVWDGTSAGIGGVTLTLTGINDLDQSLNTVVITASDGAYSFTGLRPSNLFGYTVTETQAAGYLDGKDSAGSAGGNTTTNDVISGIVLLNGGSSSVNNNFGELPAPGSLSVIAYSDLYDDASSVTAIAIDLDGGGIESVPLADSSKEFGNADGRVDASDDRFLDLSIWRDGNHETDAGELMSLAEANVLSLSLAYNADSPFWDAQGNQHLEQSSASLSDGQVLDMSSVSFALADNDAAGASATDVSPLSLAWAFA